MIIFMLALKGPEIWGKLAMNESLEIFNVKLFILFGAYFLLSLEVFQLNFFIKTFIHVTGGHTSK